MEDELWWTNGDVEEHLHGYGHYHEEYRKVEGKWLISYRTLTRLRETATRTSTTTAEPIRLGASYAVFQVTKQLLG